MSNIWKILNRVPETSVELKSHVGSDDGSDEDPVPKETIQIDTCKSFH